MTPNSVSEGDTTSSMTIQFQFRKNGIFRRRSPIPTTTRKAKKEIPVTIRDTKAQPKTLALNRLRTRSGVSKSVSIVPRSFSPTKLHAAVTVDTISGIIRKNMGQTTFSIR